MIEKIQELLTQGEEILMDARIHWVVFVQPAVIFVLALLATIFFHPIMGVVLLFLNLYPLYNAVIHYWMTHLILTNKKVMSRAGYLSRDWTQMRFSRIENAYLEEPIIGRALGYSTVIISGMGTGAIAVPYVTNGHEFVKRLERELENNSTSA